MDLSTLAHSHHNVPCVQTWATCSKTTFLSKDCHCGQWDNSITPTSAPLLAFCMSICGNRWIDALHAAHF